MIVITKHTFRMTVAEFKEWEQPEDFELLAITGAWKGRGTHSQTFELEVVVQSKGE